MHPSPALIARVAEVRRQEVLTEAAHTDLVKNADLSAQCATFRQPAAGRPRPSLSRLVGAVAAFVSGLRLMPLLAGVCAGTAALLLGSDDPEAGVVIHGSR